MNTFKYVAIAASGMETDGTVVASSEMEVGKILQQQSLVPLSIEELAESNTGIFSWWKISTSDRILLMRQLAMMTRAGITIPTALPEISKTTYKTKVREALENVHTDLQTGIPLSTAMEKENRLFNPIVCGIIAAAEETGELSPAFDRLAEALKFKQEVMNKLSMSFVYPAIIIIATILVTYALFFTFIPKLAKFLTQLGKPLPPFTQKVFDIAAFFRENALMILIGCFIFLIVFIVCYKWPHGRRVIEGGFRKIPIIGTILTYAEVSMMSSTLRSMMDSGSSLISSLPLLSKSMSTLIYRDWVDGMRDKILQGNTFEACMDKKLIPIAARSVIRTGEQSGSLPEAFGELEEYYGRLLQHKINLLVSLVNPALIVVVGSIVATVYIAIIVAIVSVNA